MIVRNKDSFKGLSSTLDGFVVFMYIKKRIYKEAVISWLNIVAINGKTASKKLLKVVPLSLVRRFQYVFVLVDLSWHCEAWFQSVWAHLKTNFCVQLWMIENCNLFWNVLALLNQISDFKASKHLWIYLLLEYLSGKEVG
jgi:hypothetical protein